MTVLLRLFLNKQFHRSGKINNHVYNYLMEVCALDKSLHQDIYNMTGYNIQGGLVQ